MFQEKDIEAYQSIKAPTELKNRIKLSVRQQRRSLVRQGVTWVSAAACLAMVVFSGYSLRGSAGILSIGDTAVSYQAVELNEFAVHSPAVASRGRSVEPQVQIPLEITATEEVHISISQGILQKTVETSTESEPLTEMKVPASGIVYWLVNGNADNPPTITITTGRKEYVYVMEFEEETAVFTIKQIK